MRQESERPIVQKREDDSTGNEDDSNDEHEDFNTNVVANDGGAVKALREEVAILYTDAEKQMKSHIDAINKDVSLRISCTLGCRKDVQCLE